MILALDVGNTNITCGVFDGDTIKASFRITTKMPRTSDEYAMIIMTLLEKNEVSVPEIHDAIICSVVPNIMHSLQNALIKYFNIKPIIVGVGIKTGIRIATSNPQQIGADRIVDAVHISFLPEQCIRLRSDSRRAQSGLLTGPEHLNKDAYLKAY